MQFNGRLHNILNTVRLFIVHSKLERRLEVHQDPKRKGIGDVVMYYDNNIINLS